MSKFLVHPEDCGHPALQPVLSRRGDSMCIDCGAIGFSDEMEAHRKEIVQLHIDRHRAQVKQNRREPEEQPRSTDGPKVDSAKAPEPKLFKVECSFDAMGTSTKELCRMISAGLKQMGAHGGIEVTVDEKE